MILLVKVIPNAAANTIESFQGGILKVRIHAPPDKGKANEELIDFLAESFHIAKKKITLISGQSSRLKKLKIEAEIDLSAFL